MFRPALILAILLCPLPGHTQIDVLLPMRDWTSSDGKTIRAELFDFEDNLPVLRLENGNLTKVSQTRFSLNDRAEIVRARLKHLHWAKFNDGTNTHFYQSKHIPQKSYAEYVSTYIAFGPNRLNLGIMIPSSKIDFRTFDQISFSNGAVGDARKIYTDSYGQNEITLWGSQPHVFTRVVVSVSKDRNRELLPVLKSGISSGRLAIAARKKDKMTSAKIIPLDENEMAALTEMLPVYEEVLELELAGIIQPAPLKSQVFGEGAAMPGQPDDGLSEFRSIKGEGRFGEILWMPEGAPAEMVQGLGWLNQDAVVRKGDGSVSRVLFAELDPAARRDILKERLEEFSKKEPVKDHFWRKIYPDNWDNHRRTFHQGITFGYDLETDTPTLFLNCYSSRFEGKPIDRASIRFEGKGGTFSVQCPPPMTRAMKMKNGLYSVVSRNLSDSEAERLIPLLDQDLISMELSSFGVSNRVSLDQEELKASKEAIAIHLWEKAHRDSPDWESLKPKP